MSRVCALDWPSRPTFAALRDPAAGGGASDSYTWRVERRARFVASIVIAVLVVPYGLGVWCGIDCAARVTVATTTEHCHEKNSPDTTIASAAPCDIHVQLTEPSPFRVEVITMLAADLAGVVSIPAETVTVAPRRTAGFRSPGSRNQSLVPLRI